MRESIKQFVEIVADMLPILEPIYEFGALQVPGQEGFADLRPIFAGKKDCNKVASLCKSEKAAVVKSLNLT
jgi:hypothetical protein